MPHKPCRWPGCPELLPRGSRGYCLGHQGEIDRGLQGRRADPRYRTKRWKIRSRDFIRRNPFCACGCGRLATDVDHVLAVEDGGAFWDEGNWQGLAHACHSRKTRAELTQRTYK